MMPSCFHLGLFQREWALGTQSVASRGGLEDPANHPGVVKAVA